MDATLSLSRFSNTHRWHPWILAALAGLWLAGASAGATGARVDGNPAVLAAPGPTAKSRLRFEVSLAPSLGTVPSQGRLFVVLNRKTNSEPRHSIGQVGFDAGPILATDTDGSFPRRPARLDVQSALYPFITLDQVPPGDYAVQPVLHTNPDLLLVNAPGDLYGTPRVVHVDPRRSGTIRLVLDQRIPDETLPPDTELVRHVKLRSELLSRFHGRPIYLRAGIILPRDFEKEPNRRYPLRVQCGGFGTRYTVVDSQMAEKGRLRETWMADDTPRFVWMQIDGAGPYGDPYYVNSENNGPYGDALVQELIPYVESTFRGIGKPYARMLAGGSTGGWVSFALQVFYPDFFNGCWSGFPDPLDFRALQLVNLYSHTNAYVNPKGFEWPCARTVDGDTLWTFRHECHLENTLGARSQYALSGGQFGSWNAVYSPKGPAGKPMAIWDPRTGEINKTVAEAWKKYDLRIILENHWDTLGPRLRGKLRCWVGDADDYFLDGGVRWMDEFLKKADPPAEARIQFEPRKRHGWNPVDTAGVLREMQAAVDAGAPKSAAANEDYLRTKFLHASNCPHCRGGR